MKELVPGRGAGPVYPEPILDHDVDHLVEAAALSFRHPADGGVNRAAKTDVAGNVAPRWLRWSPHTVPGVAHTFSVRNS
jgi:hypothetical protein